MPRSRLKATKPHKLKLDLDEFKILYRLMYAVFGSQKKAASILEVSYATYRKWETNPPTWPYWPLVLESVIKARLRGLIITRKSFTQNQYYRIKQLVGQLHSANNIMDEIEFQTYEVQGAEDHLRRLLSHKGMFFRDIIKPAHSGGYSPRTLQRAARKISIVKDTRGYGSDKETFWRLPTLETDEDFS